MFEEVDVNADRINLAIIDSYDKLKDVKTFQFEETSRKRITLGCEREASLEQLQGSSK